MIGELVLRCFHARTNAHVLHLKTRSYAQHTALQSFYEGLIPLVDSLAEGYQGEKMIDFTSPVRFALEADAVKMIEGLQDWIEEHRYEAVDAENSALHNVIDEIVLLCAQTRYKLTVLK